MYFVIIDRILANASQKEFVPFRPGEQLGDYQILRLLGAGGMGEVYQVRNTLSDRVEALKVLPASLQANKDLQERFLREIKISAALRHPNIAELRTAQRVDGLLVMVMEFVDGVTLDYLTRGGAVPLKNALHYSRQVLEALAYAHDQGVVHRDIKPQNVMVTEGDAVRLMDFGIARSLGEQTLTMTGMTLGSLFYMSPEQIRGEEVDRRSDLYSMGVLLYEMVTGQRPFQGTSGYTVMAAHLEKAPPPPIERNPDLPPPLNALILRALEKSKDARFQSANEFRDAITTLDRQMAGRIDRVPLTRAFEVKAAESPSEALTMSPKEGAVTQTMPNTPTPGSARPAVVNPESTVPGFASIPGPFEGRKERSPSLVGILAISFGLLVGLVSTVGVFGPELLRAWRNESSIPQESAAERSAEAENAAQASASAAQEAHAAALPLTQRPQPTGDSIAPPEPRPPGAPRPGDRPPPEVDEELRNVMRTVESELKAAGIDMKLFGPDAREGRRFVALERAMQFSEVASRYGAVLKRKEAMESQRREFGRALQEANRRVRGRILEEMGDHVRNISESTAAAEAAIKSQNLTLAAEKLTVAESELDVVEKIFATARERTGQP